MSQKGASRTSQLSAPCKRSRIRGTSCFYPRFIYESRLIDPDCDSNQREQLRSLEAPQMPKSTKFFELFRGATGTVRVST
jgi:hypothetical protein